MGLTGKALTVVITAAIVAGCFGRDQATDPVTARPQAFPLHATDVSFNGSTLHATVPVPVILIGFDDRVANALSKALPDESIDQYPNEMNEAKPRNVEGHPSEHLPLTLVALVPSVNPTAHYVVLQANDGLDAAFAAELKESFVPDRGLYDADRMEAWLANALPLHGFPVDANAPSIVMVHLAKFGVDRHAWRTDGQTGWLSPVRAFGERHPLLVLDPSANSDPTVPKEFDYHDPQPVDAVESHALFIRHATHFSILQGLVYPASPAPCHAVTGILGVRPTSVAEASGLFRAARDAVHPAWTKSAFDNLTKTDVFYDFKIIELPKDDPVLDAISRPEFVSMEVQRAWLTENWDRYWVPHEGCEAYLSILIMGDPATVSGATVVGIGTYDQDTGYRVSMSWINEVLRVAFDPESKTCLQRCTQKHFLAWIDFLFTHETGHIFGLHHTMDITGTHAGIPARTWAFGSVRSAMSYQQDGRVIDFGAMEHASWTRDRLGRTLALAARQGVDPAHVEAALQDVRDLRWDKAHETLLAAAHEPIGAP